jgi:hypothetical protein
MKKFFEFLSTKYVGNVVIMCVVFLEDMGESRCVAHPFTFEMNVGEGGICIGKQNRNSFHG